MFYILHCDGKVADFVPLLIEAGFDAIQPLEARAGNDVRNLKNEFGNQIVFFGNISADVLASGSKVEPAEIEQRLQANPYVSRAMVHGDGRAFLSALISLEEDRVGRFAREQHIEFADFRELAQHPAVYAVVDAAVQEQNASLPPHEQVRKFAILDRGFAPETGELTQTMDLRRRVAEERHQALLESFYRETF